jgi:glycerophosphoryl diester phosphodiesterase
VGLPLAWYAIAWIRHIPAAAGDVAAIAHRGGVSASGDADHPGEATLPAFQTAIDAGADWLEFDVRRTRDGALVVLHDATVDRTTNGSGPVTGLTLAELRSLDAGAGAVVPTVEDVVGLAVRVGVPVLPEIKDGPLNPGITGQLVDLLRAAGALEGAVIQASEAATLEELARIAPEARACWVTGWWQFDISSPPADAAFVCPMGEMVLLAPDVIRQAHAAGRTVFVWWAGVESRPANAIVAAFGADGIIVDDLGSLP